MLKALLHKIQHDSWYRDRYSIINRESRTWNYRLSLLTLAMIWNRFDFAKDFIFPERGQHPVPPNRNDPSLANQAGERGQENLRMAPDWTAEQQLTTEGLMSLMQFAIENDRQDFLREFLNRADVVKQWPNAKQLLSLYRNTQNVILTFQ